MSITLLANTSRGTRVVVLVGDGGEERRLADGVQHVPVSPGQRMSEIRIDAITGVRQTVRWGGR